MAIEHNHFKCPCSKCEKLRQVVGREIAPIDPEDLEQELTNLTRHYYKLGKKHDILVLKNRGLERENERLRTALKSINEYIQELQEDAEDCHFCEDEGPCFTCGLLLSASDVITKALEGK
jgi:hypothetical protein